MHSGPPFGCNWKTSSLLGIMLLKKMAFEYICCIWDNKESHNFSFLLDSLWNFDDGPVSIPVGLGWTNIKLMDAENGSCRPLSIKLEQFRYLLVHHSTIIQYLNRGCNFIAQFNVILSCEATDGARIGIKLRPVFDPCAVHCKEDWVQKYETQQLEHL